MKRKEFRKILDFLDKENVSDSDWISFSDPQEARSRYRDLKFLKENSGKDNEGFSPFFKRKVMSEIYAISKKTFTQTLDDVLSRFLDKVMIAGTLTVVILMLIMYVSNGQIDIDTLTGIEQDGETSFISSLFNEY